MKTRNTTIIVAGACALLLASTAIVIPKEEHERATLIRDQDNAARHPFEANCEFSGTGGPACDISVPAGVEYVIQNVVIECEVPVGYPTLIAQGTATAGGVALGGGFLRAILQTYALPSTPGYVGSDTSIALTAYADPGTQINMRIVSPDGVVTGSTGLIPRIAATRDRSCESFHSRS
jgi:hypothetical protein